MINYKNELINNQRKNLTEEFVSKMEEIKSNINSDMLTNSELNLEIARKMIANLVVENAKMQKEITKVIDKLTIKQSRLINEKGYVITDLDLDEIIQILSNLLIK